jgi:hypothetical protein
VNEKNFASKDIISCSVDGEIEKCVGLNKKGIVFPPSNSMVLLQLSAAPSTLEINNLYTNSDGKNTRKRKNGWKAYKSLIIPIK